MSDKKAYRGVLFYFKDSASIDNLPVNKNEPQTEQERQYVYIEDGLLIVESGKILAAGAYAELKNKIDGIEVVHYKNKIISI